MTAVAFDTLKLSDRRQAGGFTPEQARTAASALAEAAVEFELRTKHDLAEPGRPAGQISIDLAQQIAGLKRSLRDCQQTTGRGFLLLKQQLTRRWGGMLAAARYLPPPRP